MSNLPLAFAEILIGGIFATAGVTGNSFSDIIKGEISPQPLAGASTSTSDGPTGASSTGSTSTSMSSSGKPSAAYGKLVGAGGITPTSFAHALLQAIGAPLTAANVKSIVDWEALEGGNWKNTARFNPLNTTQPEPGYTKTGTQGDIGSYTSWAQGLQATATTLEEPIYSDIRAALDSGTGLGGKTLTGLHDWSAGPNAAPSVGYWSVP